MSFAKTIAACFLLNIFSFSYLLAQSNKQFIQKQFSKAELQQDFKAFRNRYESSLANLYLYITKQKLDGVFDSLYANILPMTGQEFYSYITPVSSLVKDGHCNVFPGNAATEYHNQYSKFFPFSVCWKEDKLFVIQNLSADTTIIEGEEITSINGISCKQIIDFLLTRQVRDGNNESYPLWIMNTYFREYYSYHFGHADNYLLVIKTATGITKEINVAALNKTTIAANKAKYSASIANQAYYFRIDSAANAAIFTIKTWDDKTLNTKIDFVSAQLKEKRIEHLILDVRNNQGGNFVPAIYLLSHLLTQPFEYFTELKSVIGKTDTSQMLKDRTGSMLGIHKTQQKPYAGKLYVLINGGCFSNAAAFCSRLEFYKRGVFIGEETGGNKTVFSGLFALNANTTLPNTKIICDNADYRLTVTDIKTNTGRGVLPTYTLATTITDLLKNNDVALNYTLRLTQER